MNYEVVELDEKVVAGIGARTNNQSPDMTAVIGGLWQKFYGEGYYAELPYKKNLKAMGIYTDYATDHNGDYLAMVACEVKQAESMPEGVMIRQYPAGKFAKFIVKGHMQTAISEFWSQLWDMELDRTYIYDFEEYQDDHVEDTEIHIYIGIK